MENVDDFVNNHVPQGSVQRPLLFVIHLPLNWKFNWEIWFQLPLLCRWHQALSRSKMFMEPCPLLSPWLHKRHSDLFFIWATFMSWYPLAIQQVPGLIPPCPQSYFKKNKTLPIHCIYSPCQWVTRKQPESDTSLVIIYLVFCLLTYDCSLLMLAVLIYWHVCWLHQHPWHSVC